MEVGPEYYVYILKRPSGEPFYVGMGKGDRVDQHEVFARRGERSHKASVIRKIWSSGGIVGKEIVARFVLDEDAKQAERDLISAIGRKDMDAGPLVNRTDGGDGVTGWSASMRKRHSIKTSNGMKNPEVIEKSRQNMLRQWSDPTIAEKFQSVAEYWKSAANRTAQSARVKQYFSDPDKRAAHGERMKLANQNPEMKQRHKKAARDRMAVPGRREAHSAMMRDLWKRPGFAEKRRATFAAKRMAKRTGNAPV
jgi:hypothetical protein